MKKASLITLVSLALCALATISSAQVLNQPNIIVMMADDMGMGDTSAYQDFTGNADENQVYTPQMERLARMGMRFTDAHTPSSRCSPTRYGLLTGRYSWRNRLKHWVLFGSQGDPMIESDRPTIASLLKDHDYRTAMFGKWHVGLRYTRLDGGPAAGWEDADLSKPLHTSPLDHGFDVARFTSRSHASSGPTIKEGKITRLRGPGHIDGRFVTGTTGSEKGLVVAGPNAYVLEELGSRHSDNAIGFMTNHVGDPQYRRQPFFLYYPANSNHGPHTPDTSIGGIPVAGAARTKSGEKTTLRNDYIYENDVALGRMIDWLESTQDPRNPGSKLIENTIVLFTSDNGAEVDSDIATGPFRSHKGSVYEGGHRVPFIVTWPAGDVGDGDAESPGLSNEAPIGLQDLYATFAEVVGTKMPDYRAGEKGGEDSFSILRAFRGQSLPDRPPLFFNDHKEAKEDPAVMAMRLDSPRIRGRVERGKWKLFFDASLIRSGVARPYELYDLSEDPWEKENLIDRPDLKPLIAYMTEKALLHRNSGGHLLAEFAPLERIVFDLSKDHSLNGGRVSASIAVPNSDLTLNLGGSQNSGSLMRATFDTNERGLGIQHGQSGDVDSGEGLLISFNRDVIIDSAGIVAGDGICGGFYQVGNGARLSIYCVDADIDDKEQSGVLSDIGVLKVGESLLLSSQGRFGSEDGGQWRLRTLAVRPLE